jgi:hypothetical protein
MDAIEALRYLERAGKASAAGSRRMREAAGALAAAVKQAIPADLYGRELPRGYNVRLRHTADGPAPRLYRGHVACEPVDDTIGRRGPLFDVAAHRDAVARLARDVADGWLRELAAFLDDCAAADDGAARELETAAAEILTGERWPGPCYQSR